MVSSFLCFSLPFGFFMNLPPHHIKQHLSASDVHRRVVNMVEEITQSLDDKPLVIVGVLRGSFMFLADLVRELHPREFHPQIDFMTLQSYGSATTSSGNVNIAKDVTVSLDGMTVLLVDDILDSGRTLSFAVKHMFNKGAAKVHTCCLLDKPDRRILPIHADFIGFTIPDTFVVGYGLDYDSHYRELPYIGEVIFDE
jgi:hypoxanthine phosphoribosyltransferase